MEADDVGDETVFSTVVRLGGIYRPGAIWRPAFEASQARCGTDSPPARRSKPWG